MLRSCQYCGRIHERSYICPQKAQALKERQKRRTEQNKENYDFHRSQAWKEKSRHIRERDQYCCQICAKGLYGAERKYETDELSVHHIVPLAEDWDRRFDNDNLLTLCRRHHEMAERGEIPRDILLNIAREQEERNSSPLIG